MCDGQLDKTSEKEHRIDLWEDVQIVLKNHIGRTKKSEISPVEIENILNTRVLETSNS